MYLPEIYADFNNLDGENRIRLTTLGSVGDIARLGIQLRDGMSLIVTTDDADDNGESDDLMADAVVHYNEKEKCWVAQVDWSRVQNRSERQKGSHVNQSPDLMLEAAPVAKAKTRKPKSDSKTRGTAHKS